MVFKTINTDTVAEYDIKMMDIDIAQCTFTSATGTTEDPLQFQKIEGRLRVKQKTIVMHAYTAYALTITFVPVMAWQDTHILNPGTLFSSDCSIGSVLHIL
ncbi:hypothetical protein CROQUDRAFT_671337 [Cronartium quercuum f. sp. fusiforme G11]|uniref:Uncharacterized protein n=1 Tax=Cronartium quercuum f. sp. fusiforme G11 TaxID=708437 RepID=A0A9P6NFX0_9BASI|nr:hypothetical protein CROQUDRAFT_671337 [Cronartium quercuum f. sp. fusiforme G11]